MSFSRLLLLTIPLLLSGCALFKPADHFEASRVELASLKGWNDDKHAEALSAFLDSCPMLSAKARPATKGSGIAISPSVWKKLCAKANATPLTNPAAKAFFEANFTPYRVMNNGNEQGLFTGYYEPLLYGSPTKHGDFKYPLYLTPPDLKKPYFTRKEIDEGALKGRHLELVWVDDPVMLFFLHIQGSGRILLPGGKEFLAGYAQQNGHGYVGLGKIMGDEGLVSKDNMNFFTIRQWLYDNPDKAFAMMQRNPSYVFFKRLTTDRVVGAVGAPLTPKRSLAVDNAYIPYGVPMFLEASLPDIPGSPKRPFNQLMIAHDTGGAIRSPVRGDVFFGHGQEAEYLAGYMKPRGRYTMLVPKQVASQLE